MSPSLQMGCGTSAGALPLRAMEVRQESVYRRRRGLALAVVGAVALLLVIVVAASGGGEESSVAPITTEEPEPLTIPDANRDRTRTTPTEPESPDAGGTPAPDATGGTPPAQPDAGGQPAPESPSPGSQDPSGGGDPTGGVPAPEPGG